MSLWGKIAGAIAGYALGGVPGALIGGIAGHFVMDRLQDRQVVFTIALIALAAKMSKADGVVSPIEIDAVYNMLRVPEKELANMGRVFRMAQSDIAGYDFYAKQITDIYADSPKVLEDVLDVLFYIAFADGELAHGEEIFLREIADIFGISDGVFAHIRARHDDAYDDPYFILGIGREASDAHLRKAYLAAVQNNHPDQMQARGVPSEMMHIATARMAVINEAWRKIKQDRGLT